MICDACNVRPEWKGEHRCHTANGQKEMLVQGVRVYAFCDCYLKGDCRPPSEEEIKAFRRTHGKPER